ncbi:MAG: hypothetical protein AB1632_13075 [Nitrospirota bacterium]
MAWKCPECGNKNDDPAAECACGYAFYKMLGIKPDTPGKEVRQTYKYLINIWRKNSSSRDPHAVRNAVERLKKINEAYDIFKNIESSPSGEKRNYPVKSASFAVILIVFATALFLIFNTSEKDKTAENTAEQTDDKSSVRPDTVNQGRLTNKPDESRSRPQGTISGDNNALNKTSPVQGGNFTEDVIPEKTEEGAIELVKKSRVLDRFSNVETIMKKWTDENPGKFKVIGWKARKVDDQIYMVSYSVSDSTGIKGFYFDVDFSTGAVRHLLNHPEILKKYGIQYNQ